MAQVLFVLELPTPQRTPTLDQMFRQGVELRAAYHIGADSAHGWGDVVPGHPSVVLTGGTLRRCLTLSREVLRADLRVLCCFGYHRPANVLAVLVARLRGIQVVTRSDSNWLLERRRPRIRRTVKQALLRAIFGRRTRVWTIGGQNDRYWAEMGLPNRHLIPYGIPEPPVGTPGQGVAFRREHQLGAGLVLLHVGVLEERKGVATLIEAFRALPAEDARLVLVGDGSLMPLVRRAAAEDPRIVACGALPQSSLAAAYAAADVLVLASVREPWGLVVDEAQSNGLRVVVSDAVGAGPDRVTADNGWVFPAGDAGGLGRVLATAVAEHRVGWKPLAPVEPYLAAPEMTADLVRLGVTLRPAAARTGPVRPG